MTIHKFAESLARSKAYTDAPWWHDVYRLAFPDFLSMSLPMPDGRQSQLAGIDRVITLSNGRTLTVDEKVREKDYADFALEFWSDKSRRKPGWVAKDQMCDFIAYAFAPSRTCYLLPFQPLRRAWTANCDGWVRRYGRRQAQNEGYVTEFVCVPIPLVMDAIAGALTVIWPACAA